MVLRWFLFCVLGVALSLGPMGCAEDPASPSLFERRSPEETGLTFKNELAESPDLNILNYLYYYNGGGVAAGDVSGNSRVDLYFTANEGSNALYLNRGDFRFDDVTEAAGVGGTADWSTGVTMADVNGDGRLDIYVSVVQGILGLEGHNQLFINQGPDDNGIPQFEERAPAYNLDQRRFGTQAAFFDYDGDGDLDVYLLNSSIHEEQTYGRGTLREQESERAGDRLLRNDDSTFVDVTDKAGIYSGRTGYGLGVAVSDLDQNGCPDLYVANDFHEHDYLYYNQCDGTFNEAIEQATGHVSYSSMGVDAADFNNDGRPDVAVLDMLPFEEEVLNTSGGADSEDTYELKRQYGYHHQLDRNTLQLNQGNKRFSEIGLLAGIAATDWSWAPLFADLDNDGRKDLFVTNGIYRRPNDLDYIEYASRDEFAQKTENITAADLSIQDRLPQRPVQNFSFHNDGNLTFSDSTDAWGLDSPGFSNGAAYADLDNDGTLDLIVNNVDAPASIYENRADSLRDHHYLKVRLEGRAGNTRGVGVNVRVHQGEWTQLLEQMPTRGYQSSVDPRLHVGLGTRDVDSVTVTWPNGDTERRTQVRVDQTMVFRQTDATPPAPKGESAEENPPFAVLPADTLGIDFRHEENTSYDDFHREPLMPRRLSTEGPALAVGDATGNGLDDVYLGGAKRQPGALYVQQPDGQFRRATANDSLWSADRVHEDVDASFFDATGNGALDLYVVSGGNEFWGDADALRDRLYRNDGSGTFRRAEDALPEEMTSNGAVVAPGDVDEDGHVDLFVGSRAVAREYEATPTSYLLENDGRGHFEDVTDEVAPALRSVGMVTDATWTDVRGSQASDLVVVGEWMPVTLFEQNDGRLVDRTEAAGLADTQGWWNAVHAVGRNGDGAPELIVGNLGLNSRLKTSPESPVQLYRNDFVGDGNPAPILTRYTDGTRHPWAGRDLLLERFPSLRDKFPTYESFGAAQLEDLFSRDKIREAAVETAQTFATSNLQQQEDGTFAVEPLPSRAQLAPVYGILVDDLDKDGTQNVLLGGNFYGVRPKQGRYDASYGTVLRRVGAGTWAALPPYESNVYLSGEVRAFELLTRADGSQYVLVARNNDQPQVVRLRRSDVSQTVKR